MAKKPLTESRLSKLQYSGKTQKIYDRNGLYISVGKKSLHWRYRYRVDGQDTTITIGTYPEVNLKKARQIRQELEAKVKTGVNLVRDRQQTALQNKIKEQEARTFADVAEDWLVNVHCNKVGESHYKRNCSRVNMYLIPSLGHLRFEDITPLLILDALRAIERAGHMETAKRVCILSGQIFRYATTIGAASGDPTPTLKDAMGKTPEVHHPAIVDADKALLLMKDIQNYSGRLMTRNAMLLSALLFARPGEIRHMKWTDLNEDFTVWNFVPSKGGAPILVNLPAQAVTILESQNTMRRNEFVFFSPAGGGKAMSENCVNQALHRMGYRSVMSAHGFRAMARTLLVEKFNCDPNVVEVQLGHAVRDTNGRAYNRATYLEARTEMLQTWANFLLPINR